MSTWSRSPAEKRRERFWRTAPPDPARVAKRSGRSYFRAGHGRVLTPHDMMPCGEHQGKHMRAVPADYLLWVNAQPWAPRWLPWQPVADYLTRYHPGDEAQLVTIDTPLPSPPENVVLYTDMLQKWLTDIPCFKDGSSHLHCLPGFEDCLHAFAVGALGLKRAWYQRGVPPHYDLSAKRHAWALHHPCLRLIEDPQLIEHRRLWREHFASRPQFDTSDLPDRTPRPKPFDRLNGNRPS